MSDKRRKKCKCESAERCSNRGRRKSAYYEKDYHQVVDALIEVLDDYSDEWITMDRLPGKVAERLGVLYTSRVDWLCKCVRAILLDLKASGLIVVVGRKAVLLPQDEGKRLQVLNEGLVHIASAGDRKMIPILLNKGADVNTLHRGRTALMQAAYSDQAGVVQALLALGADPTIKNEWGNSALRMARKAGSERIVKILEEISA